MKTFQSLPVWSLHIITGKVRFPQRVKLKLLLRPLRNKNIWFGGFTAIRRRTKDLLRTRYWIVFPMGCRINRVAEMEIHSVTPLILADLGVKWIRYF